MVIAIATGNINVLIMIANVTASNATKEPTDKSIPPVKITINIPMLIIPIPETCFNKLDRFIDVKNTSDIIAEKITSNTKMNIVLYFIKNLRIPPGLLNCFFIVNAIISKFN